MTNTPTGPTTLNLKERRRDAGLSAPALAERAECSRNTIHLIEGGYQSTPQTLNRIDAALRAVERAGESS